MFALVGRVAILSLLVSVASCMDEDVADETTVADGGKADGIAQFDLAITTSSGVLRAKETPKLGSSSTSFACAVDDRTEGGWRLLCTRGKERLSLLYGADEQAGAGVYVKSDTLPDRRAYYRDRRAYYRCTATTQPAGAWPSKLHCTAKQPVGMIAGQMVSPFASTIANVGIRNAHVVAKGASGASLVRGMKPFRTEDFTDLTELDVAAVLMFKRPTAATEVSEEADALADIGIPASRFVSIPFGWKNFSDFEEPCRQTVQGLKALAGWVGGGRTAFLHCTVGEDRTGYLAGLYRLLTDSSASVDAIFGGELCEHGFSSGNPQKPFAGVAKEIDEDLTPLFLKMAFKIATGELTPSSLSEAVCASDPADDPQFAGTMWDATAYRCKPSALYRL
jgi:hypothetical protein